MWYSNKEHYFVDGYTFLDGYCKETKTVYEYMDCDYDVCSICCKDKINSNDIHPERGIMYKLIHHQNIAKFNKLSTHNLYSNVVIHWSHDNHLFLEDPTWNWDKEKSNIIHLRDIFFGGRTEVFAAYCQPALLPDQTKIEYNDVCSLYPYVCSFKDLPKSHHQVFFNNESSIKKFGNLKDEKINSNQLLKMIIKERKKSHKEHADAFIFNKLTKII